MFSPLKAVFGDENVMLTPEKGGFPLAGLESKRVVLLDEWRFNASVISLSTQLLWKRCLSRPVWLADMVA